MPYISFKTNHKLTLRQENTIVATSYIEVVAANTSA